MARSSTQTATITSGGTTSSLIDIEGVSRGSFITDAAFDGTTIDFSVSIDGTTFVPFEVVGGTSYQITAQASAAYEIPEAIMNFNYLKFIAGTQTGDSVLTVVLNT